MSIKNKKAEASLPKPQVKKEAHIGVDGGGTIRASIFGVNDGLVSNTALILGVAGATADNSVIVIAGTAGLLAGAFSMAAGEWISMQSQRELFEREIEIERREIHDDPESEILELAEIYQKRGMPKKQAVDAARAVMKDPKAALDVHVREELGLNPDELGSPWKAAGSSFVSFIIGGIIPLAPFFFLSGTKAVVIASTLAAAALFIVGATLGIFTRKNWLYSGARMLLIGGLAAAVTHFIGRWLGVNVS
jgi:vacuolar iron transporter family protein